MIDPTAFEILQHTTDKITLDTLIAERDGGRALSEMASECEAAYPDLATETQWIDAIRRLRPRKGS